MLRQATDWIEANADIRLLTARTNDRAGLAHQADTVEQSRADFVADLGRLLGELQFDLQRASGSRGSTRCRWSG